MTTQKFEINARTKKVTGKAFKIITDLKLESRFILLPKIDILERSAETFNIARY